MHLAIKANLRRPRASRQGQAGEGEISGAGDWASERAIWTLHGFFVQRFYNCPRLKCPAAAGRPAGSSYIAQYSTSVVWQEQYVLIVGILRSWERGSYILVSLMYVRRVQNGVFRVEAERVTQKCV